MIRYDEQSVGRQGCNSACKSSVAPREAEWRILSKPFDGVATIRGAKEKSKSGYSEVTLDISETRGITEVDLSRQTMVLTNPGPQRISSDPPVENVDAGPETKIVIGNGQRNILKAGENGTEIYAGPGDSAVGNSGKDVFFYDLKNWANKSPSGDARQTDLYGFDRAEDKIVIATQNRDLCERLKITKRDCGWSEVSLDEDNDGRADFALLVNRHDLQKTDIQFQLPDHNDFMM